MKTSKERIKPKALPPIGNLDNPNSLYHWGQRFITYREERQYSAYSQRALMHGLRYFLQWCETRGLEQANEITRPILEQYQRYLHQYRKSNGHPLSAKTQNGRITPLKAWFSWLVRNHHILSNPASDLDYVREGTRLPCDILSVTQIEHVMRQPDISTALGLRNRAILETFYSTGMRRLELAQLACTDIHYEREVVNIREGKGQQDRVIPIGTRALHWIQRYLSEGRDSLLYHGPCPSLFVDNLGQALHPDTLSGLVKQYLREADITISGACHLFRHSCATQMLDNGADVRYVQALLGHKHLNTTAIYTHVSIQKLKEIHKSTHPANITHEKIKAERTV